jgi:hypothetical protein
MMVDETNSATGDVANAKLPQAIVKMAAPSQVVWAS